jgi:hypothetical protein
MADKVSIGAKVYVDTSQFKTGMVEASRQTQTATAGMTKSMNAATTASKHHARSQGQTAQMISQLGYAAEDAIVSFGTNGLAGAFRGAGNNLAFMATMINPAIGAIVGIGAAVAGVVAGMWESSDAIEDNTDKAERFADQVKKLNDRVSLFKSGISSGYIANDLLATGSVSDVEGRLEGIRRESKMLLDVMVELDKEMSRQAQAAFMDSSLTDTERNAAIEEYIEKNKIVLKQQEEMRLQRKKLKVSSDQLRRILPEVQEREESENAKGEELKRKLQRHQEGLALQERSDEAQRHANQIVDPVGTKLKDITDDLNRRVDAILGDRSLSRKSQRDLIGRQEQAANIEAQKIVDAERRRLSALGRQSQDNSAISGTSFSSGATAFEVIGRAVRQATMGSKANEELKELKGQTKHLSDLLDLARKQNKQIVTVVIP